MGTVKFAEKAILFAGLLYSRKVEEDYLYSNLQENFGKIILTSKSFKFTESSYYEKEMGDELTRVFVAFNSFIDMEQIVDIKLKSNSVEQKIFSLNGRRNTNIDPGYLTNSKVVLATTKDFQHRIYMNNGIYAEVTLRYLKGNFIPWEWTYKDYKRPETIDFFNDLRKFYRIKINDLRNQETFI